MTLAAELGIKDARVYFGQFGSDIVLDYTLVFKLYKGSKKGREIFSDELKIISQMNVKALDYIVYVYLK